MCSCSLVCIGQNRGYTRVHMCAGVIVKHVLDGSVGPLEPGQSPAEAAHDAHMAFAEYLASHSLSLDAWDGDSLLQVSLVCLCQRGCVCVLV